MVVPRLELSFSWRVRPRVVNVRVAPGVLSMPEVAIGSRPCHPTLKKLPVYFQTLYGGMFYEDRRGAEVSGEFKITTGGNQPELTGTVASLFTWKSCMPLGQIRSPTRELSVTCGCRLTRGLAVTAVQAMAARAKRKEREDTIVV